MSNIEKMTVEQLEAALRVARLEEQLAAARAEAGVKKTEETAAVVQTNAVAEKKAPTVKCKFGRTCNNKKCNFKHPEKREQKEDEAAAAVQTNASATAAKKMVPTETCKFGKNCNSLKVAGFTCNYIHPGEKRTFAFTRREEKKEEETNEESKSEDGGERELSAVPTLEECWKGTREEFEDAINQFAAYLFREGCIKQGDANATEETSRSAAEFHSGFKKNIHDKKTVLCIKQHRDIFWVFRKGKDWRVSLFGEVGEAFGRAAQEKMEEADETDESA